MSLHVRLLDSDTLLIEIDFIIRSFSWQQFHAESVILPLSSRTVKSLNLLPKNVDGRSAMGQTSVRYVYLLNEKSQEFPGWKGGIDELS